MKTNLITLTTMLFSSIVFSQAVGINTSNPQGIMHVDGAKDNASTGAPTAAQQQNDFIVASTGNVGIGITAPSRKLDINSPTAGAIKIVDGTQGTNKILTSDANGVGTWVAAPFQVSHKVFPINATTPTVSEVLIGGMGFRVSLTTCVDTFTEAFQVRSTTGVASSGELRNGIYSGYNAGTNQNYETFRTTNLITYANANTTPVGMSCTKHGAYSYNYLMDNGDFYRVYVGLSPNGKYGATGSITVEYRPDAP